MRRIAIGGVWASLAFLVLAAGCSDSDDKSPTATVGGPSTTTGGSSLTVGALLPLSGDLASYGETSQAALDEAVAALQADGNRVSLLVKDTTTDPAKALEGLTSLKDQGVKLVIGPYASSEVRQVKDFADKNGIILISPLSTATSLAVPDDNVLRFTPDDEQEGVAVANLAYADGIRMIVPITRDDEGNKGLQSSMKPVFEALGGTVAPLIMYPAGTEDFTDTVRDLVAGVSAASAQGGPVGIYLTAFGEVTKLFNATAGMPELESLKWYGSDSVALSKGLLEDPTAAAFAVKAGYPNPILGLREADSALWKPVVDRLTQRLGRTPDAFALAAYDALVVGVKGLRDTTEGEGAPGLRKAIVDAAQDYTGLTGPTELNDAGDRSLGNYDFWAVCKRQAGDEWVRVATYTAGTNGSAGEAKRETRC
jgi:branched-chain amino acid transport system substrate-binding protein